MTTLNTGARRRWLLLALAAAALAGCGGGSDPQNDVSLTADRSSYLIGEQARLTVRYSSGQGRIEPGVGPVASGSTVTTPPLDGSRHYRLIVDTPEGSVSRELTLPVAYRNRYVALDTEFSSYGHEAVPQPDGSVLLVSGSRGESITSHRVTRFDPATRTLSHAGWLQVGRTLFRATPLADGRLLITGGETSISSGIVIEVFDPRSGTSEIVGQGAVRRADHTATRLADGRVLITGGNAGPLIHASAELWDPATRTSRLLAARMTHGRSGHSATLLADGRVLLAGGFPNPGAAYRTAEIFDPRTETFTPIGPVVAQSRALHATLALPDGSVIIAGGEHLDPVTQDTLVLGSAQRIAPAAGTITEAPALLAPRSVAGSVTLADGRLALFGGVDAAGELIASAEIYSAMQGSVAIAALPAPRLWHTVTRLPDGRLLIAGGSNVQRDYAPQLLIYE